MPAYVIALVVTLVIEVPLVAVLYPGERVRLACAALAANAATNLALNLALAPAGHLVLGELVALVGEAMVYASVSRRRSIPHVLVASAAANLASFTLGPLLAHAALG